MAAMLISFQYCSSLSTVRVSFSSRITCPSASVMTYLTIASAAPLVFISFNVRFMSSEDCTNRRESISSSMAKRTSRHSRVSSGFSRDGMQPFGNFSVHARDCIISLLQRLHSVQTHVFAHHVVVHE